MSKISFVRFCDFMRERDLREILFGSDQLDTTVEYQYQY